MGRRLEHVDQLKESPVVGRNYYVPCVKGNPYPNHVALQAPGTRWLPTRGEWHEDPELGNDIGRHIHFDFRFVDLEKARDWLSRKGHPWEVAGGQEDMVIGLSMFLVIGSRAVVSEEIEYKRLKCQRPYAEIHSNVCLDGRTYIEKPTSLVKLEGLYGGQRMKCMTCPHKNNDLSSLPVRDGVVVCDNHGLAWNVETGENVPR